MLKIHHLYAKPSREVFQRGAKALPASVPAILTNVATIRQCSRNHGYCGHGDQAVAGWAVVSALDSYGSLDCLRYQVRLAPSSARISVPNVFDRLRQTMRDSLKFTLIYVSIVWLLLAISSHWIARAFDAHGMAEDVIVFLRLYRW